MPVIESTKTDARLGNWNGDVRRPTSARTTRDRNVNSALSSMP